MPGDPTPTSPATSGCLAAITEMAGWVRFADTKATILAAGLGVVITMLTNSTEAVVKALDASCLARLIVGGFAAATVISFLWTLFWIIRAIAPRSALPYNKLNRFAWPSLVGATADQLVEHAERNSIEADAWQQVLDLAGIAKRKFDACKFAIYGFGTMIIVGFFTVLSAAAFTST
ncbi:hypothetical protein EB73_20240 [Mycobacterium sp. SWH-M3]|nr:hypothetical protein EB73_20240 [Mycobacterium sp. SWH-M3]